MPDRFESGTPNLPWNIWLETALGFIERTGIESLESHEKDLMARFLDGLAELKNVCVYGPKCIEGRTGVVSVGFKKRDNAEAAWLLESEYGVLTRAACTAPPRLTGALAAFRRAASDFHWVTPIPSPTWTERSRAIAAL